MNAKFYKPENRTDRHLAPIYSTGPRKRKKSVLKRFMAYIKYLFSARDFTHEDWRRIEYRKEGSPNEERPEHFIYWGL